MFNLGLETTGITFRREAKSEIEPNIKQQNKIVSYFKEGERPEVLERDVVILENKERDEFLKKVASGEIEKDDFKRLLLIIQSPINPEEPARLFSKIFENKQMEKMIAYLVFNDPELHKSIGIRDAEKFLTEFPEPFSFEEKIQYLLNEIKMLNPLKKYDEYKNSKEELMKKIYGKRYEYYKQLEILKKEAEKKYPDLVKTRSENV